MKKFIVFVIGLCICEMTMAQKFNAAVRAGITMSQLSGDNLSGYHKLGAYIGGNIDLPLTKIWALQFELNMVMKGSTSAVNLSAEHPDLYYSNFIYIQTPALVKITLFKNANLELGPVLNVLCYGVEHDANGKISNRKNFNRFEFSALVGVSYFIKGHYGINVRYEHSI